MSLEQRLKRLYFKRAKGKAIVRLNGDNDISALLKEYPMTYPSGKKKPGRLTTMYLAVELEKPGKIMLEFTK